MGYNIDSNTQAFLRAEVDGWRTQNANLHNPQSIWDKFTFDLVRKVNDQITTALEVGYNLRSKSLTNSQLVVQLTNEAKQTVKVGLNQNLDVNLLVKRPWQWKNWFDNATISAGLGVTGITKKSLTVKTGFELAINL